MTFQEIIKECDIQIGISGKEADVMLLIPGKWGKTNKRKLCKLKGAPYGEIVCDDFGRGLHVMFNAIEVKEFIMELLDRGIKQEEPEMKHDECNRIN